MLIGGGSLNWTFGEAAVQHFGELHAAAFDQSDLGGTGNAYPQAMLNLKILLNLRLGDGFSAETRPRFIARSTLAA